MIQLPEWGGSSSPVKNGASPDCIIVVVVLEKHSRMCLSTLGNPKNACMNF